MRKIIHANDATTRVSRPGDPISFTSRVSLGAVGARYNYDNVGAIPSPFPEGLLFQQSASLILRLHPVDLDGQNHDNVLAAMQAGDSITVGTQTATLTGKPGYQGPYWNVPVAAFPALTPGEYRVKVYRERLGPDLVDTMNTAAAWAPRGTNTVEDDAGQVKVTFVSDTIGASALFRETAGLITDLAVGKRYKVTGKIRINIGTGSVDTVPAPAEGLFSFTSTTLVDFSRTFTATSPTANYLSIASMGTGEIIWITGIEVREITSQ